MPDTTTSKMTDQYFPSKLDTSRTKKLRSPYKIARNEYSGTYLRFERLHRAVTYREHPRYHQRELEEYDTKEELERPTADQDKLNEYKSRFVPDEMAPSRFLYGEMMEVTLDELPVRWRKSNRNRLVSSYEVVPQSRRVIALEEDDFDFASAPTPVNKNVSRDEEDDWEYLTDYQERNPISYASVVSKKEEKLRNGKKI